MREGTLVVLCVGREATFATLLREVRERSHEGPVEIVYTESVEDELGRLERGHFDAVLIDLAPAAAPVAHELMRLQNLAAYVPILVVVGCADEQMGFEALRLGAQDFVFVGEDVLGRMSRILRCAVERYRFQSRLRASACLDELTGLYNRRGLLTVGEDLVMTGNHTCSSGRRMPPVTECDG